MLKPRPGSAAPGIETSARPQRSALLYTGLVAPTRHVSIRVADILLLSALLALIFFTISVAPAQEAPAAQDNRLVLGLYDSTENALNASNVHKLLEFPLNRLGCVVEYHDVSQPPLPDFRRYRALCAWYVDDKMDHPNEYLEWLRQAALAGVRLVLINELGAERNPQGQSANGDLIREVYAAIDVRSGDIPFLMNPFVVKTTPLIPEAFGFEAKGPDDEAAFRDYRSAGPGMKVWLEVSRSDLPGASALAIGAGSKGGFIVDSQLAARSTNSPAWQFLWYLNPMRFLEEALGLGQNLRPDTTSAFSLRAAFSHIDGDGIRNLTQDIPGPQRPAADVLLKQIIRAYPVPITVSYIAAETETSYGTAPKVLDLMRTIMAEPTVTPAAHGYAHPMYWNKKILGLKVPGYVYDPIKETAGAIEIVTKNTCPPEKPAELMLWTGDCQPGADAFPALAAKGYLNMNGGDPRYDPMLPGIFGLCPLTVQVGAYRQIYAAGSNEFIYTDGWKENFSGFANYLVTLRNTERPRYLPVDIYYHIYLCERAAGLSSLKQIYSWAVKQPLCWITAPEYCRSVLGFLSCRTGSGGGEYWISNYGELRTVRIDNTTAHVEMESSTNIAGYAHFDGSLYVSLLPGERAAFRVRPDESKRPYIRASTSLLRKTVLTAQAITVEARLFTPGYLEAGGLPVREALVGGKTVTLQDGRIPLPEGRGEWVEVQARF